MATPTYAVQGLFYHETSETFVSELFRYSGACGGGWFTLVPYLAPQHDGWAGSVAVLREFERGSTK